MVKIKKHVILLLILIGALSAYFSRNIIKEKNDNTTVRLNEVVHSVFYAPQYVAIEKGFFKSEGLNIELSVGQGADKTMTALISGDADIGLCGTEAAIYVYNEGKEDYAKAFAQLTQTAGNFLIGREKQDGEFDYEGLRGKKIIGGRPGGMPEMVLEYVLRHKGIEPFKDVEIMNNLQFESTAGAFVSGTGDYTAEFEPTAFGIEQSGAGYVVSALGTQTGHIPYTVYMARESYIENNKDTVQRFTNAVYKGQKWVASHSSKEIAEAISPRFAEFSVDDLSVIIDRYKSIGAFRENPMYQNEDFELFQDIMQEGGELSKRVTFDKLIDNSFAQKAVGNG